MPDPINSGDSWGTIRGKINAVLGTPGLVADAEAAQAAAQAAAAAAEDSAVLAQAWAEGTEPGGPGTKSALNSANSAVAAAQAAGEHRDAAEAARDEVMAATAQTFDDLPALLAYTGPGFGVGSIWRTALEGYSFEQADPSATVFDRTVDGHKLIGKGPADLRRYANVRGAINFFDFLQDTRSSAERESIANGSHTLDLTAEWTAFRNALAADAAAGRRPHGIIPQCTIRHNANLNFAFDFLRLETQGNVRVIATGTTPGIRFDGYDGVGLGVNGFGFRRLYVGPIEASTLGGNIGYQVQYCHKSTFERPSSLGASVFGIAFQGCVTSELRMPVVSSQVSPWLNGNRPQTAIYLGAMTRVDSTRVPCSWSSVLRPIAEYTRDYGIFLDFTFGCSFAHGVSEGIGQGGGLGRGLGINAETMWAYVEKLDCEFNTGLGAYIAGSRNTLVACDFQQETRFAESATRNHVKGGQFENMTFAAGTNNNLVDGSIVFSLTDSGTGQPRNRFSNVMTTDGVSQRWLNHDVATTPAVTAQTGTLTTASASFRHTLAADGTVTFTGTITVLNNGTGASWINTALPFPVRHRTSFAVVAVEIDEGGTPLNLGVAAIADANAGSATLRIRNLDGTYPVPSTRRLFVVSGSYDRQ